MRFAALLLLLMSVLAVGCRPLYLPLVPELTHPDPRPRIEAGMAMRDGVPVVSVRMLEVPEEGWLAVQWFGPDNREAASASVWVDGDSTGAGFNLPLPEDVPVRPGEWRVLLSIHSVVLRQLSLVVEGS